MAFLFDFSRGNTPVPKVIFTYGQLPSRDDWLECSKLRKPISTIWVQPWAQSVELIVPEHVYQKLWPDIQTRLQGIQYCRVFMPLSALLEGDFFNKCIKGGEIEMLSEGRSGIDSKYTLKDGILRLQLPKDLYERAGLAGKPIQDSGRKHKQSLFLIELDLRASSMVHGKKGFERIVWAFRNVLSYAVTWLFRDAQAVTNALVDSAPIAVHQPIFRVAQPAVSHLGGIVMPTFPLESPNAHSVEAHEDATDLLEWLSLVSLESPRIKSKDSIDPYLSRYAVPNKVGASGQDLVRVRWKGFISAEWVQQLFMKTFSTFAQEPASWLALAVRSFETVAVDAGNGYTILTLPSDGEPEAGKNQNEARKLRDYYLWEIISGVDTR